MKAKSIFNNLILSKYLKNLNFPESFKTKVHAYWVNNDGKGLPVYLKI